MTSVTSQIRDGIAVITVDHPPVNALSAGVKTGLDTLLEQAFDDPAVRAVVIIGAGETFISGADIKELLDTAFDGIVCSTLPETLMKIEDSQKCVIAAIHGSTLGAGLETAMAAHYRIAKPGTTLGQPEVKLGLIPAAGGTQRLTRLIGAEKAVEMCVFGESISAEEGHQLGIIDRMAAGDLLENAIAFAREIEERGGPLPRARERTDKLSDQAANSRIFAAARDRARLKRPNLVAPLAAIEAVEGATTMSFIDGCRKEREIFGQLLGSEQANALIHVFFTERLAAKISEAPKGHTSRGIRKAAVVGAGTMGRGIAMCYANAGIPVLLKESEQTRLDAGMDAIRGAYESSASRGQITRELMETSLSQIHPQLDYRGFDGVDVITEAVFEDLALKKAVLAELSSVASPDAIITTNTSYFDIDLIATATSHPENFAAMHFFSPAHVMRLVEVVPGQATSPDVISACMALAKRLGKVAVIAGNSPGFIGNRMLRAYRREAQFLLEEGATPEQADGALKEWGMTMGPFAAQDLAGIDIAVKGRQAFQHLAKTGYRVPLVMEKLYAMGRYGQKSGAGWYRYDEKRRALADPEVHRLIEETAREAGIARREIFGQEIVERTIYALILEGTRILEEGHALRASDIDVVYVNGYGFPAYRGGPMCYADTVGLRTVYDHICEFRKSQGEHWNPPILLAQLAAAGESFSVWDERRSSLAAVAPAGSDVSARKV